MDPEIKHKVERCEHADSAEWGEVVALAQNLGTEQKAFIREHPPGLVKALWMHFAATRDRCGCKTSSHELPGCAVGLVERLLLDADIA
jgi:hypothetical protein